MLLPDSREQYRETGCLHGIPGSGNVPVYPHETPVD
jgi:hypothetical protein